MMFLHLSTFPAPPEAGNMCCASAAYTDGERCDCWTPILWPPQESAELDEGPENLRRRMCHDCAYRPDSPERASEDGALPRYGPNMPFSCHQGMPRVTVWVHPMTGITRPVTEDDYKPATRGGRGWLADGTPAELCAGWGATNHIRYTTRKKTY